MFCPKCATQNLDDAKFCRKCGTDISLVARAIAGNLPVVQAESAIEEAFDFHRHKGRRGRPPTMDRAISQIMSGVGFVFMALLCFLFAPGGKYWWFWLLMPAFFSLSQGVGAYLRVKELKKAKAEYQPPANVLNHATAPASLPPRNTAELFTPPPSVTEGTTRLLAVDPPTRPLNSSVEAPAEQK